MSRSEVRSRYHHRSGYGSGSRDSGYSQGAGAYGRRRGSRTPSIEYERSMDRDRGGDRWRERYRGSSRSRTPVRYRSSSRGPPPPYSGDGYGGPSSHRFTPEPCRVLGVFGLNMRTTERDLKKLFSAYGELEKVVIIYHHATQQSRRFGFISFKHLESASLARRKVNGMEFHDRKIRVDYSVTQRAHSPTPGRYMGRGSIQRRSYRPGSGYGGYPHDDPYDRRERRRDSTPKSQDMNYNDRPSSNTEPAPHDGKWENKKDFYSPSNKDQSREHESNGEEWQQRSGSGDYR